MISHCWSISDVCVCVCVCVCLFLWLFYLTYLCKLNGLQSHLANDKMSLIKCIMSMLCSWEVKRERGCVCGCLCVYVSATVRVCVCVCLCVCVCKRVSVC